MQGLQGQEHLSPCLQECPGSLLGPFQGKDLSFGETFMQKQSGPWVGDWRPLGTFSVTRFSSAVCTHPLLDLGQP